MIKALLPPRSRLVLPFLLAAALAAAFAVASAAGPGQAQEGDEQPLYLPFMVQSYSPPPPPGSFTLIDEAVAAGKLDEETALVYKTFANFGDPRLPAAYQSSEVGGEAGLFMLEVVDAFPTLSAENQALLEPFFIPPYMQGSWMAQGYHGASTSADWSYIPAAGGKVRVWYKTANAQHRQKAAAVANAMTTDIWPKLTGLMQRQPIPDSAGVQNIVVYDHYRPSWTSTFVPFTTAAGYAVPQTCSPTASILYINATMNITTGVRSQGMVGGMIETTAHEFMHALQFSYNLAVNPCLEYRWLGEATAAWAEDYVYPDHDFEWRVAKYYLDSPSSMLNDTHHFRDYGIYLLVYQHTQRHNDPGAVRMAWQAAQTVDSLEAFYALGGLNFEQVISLWNKEPFGTFFKDHDTLPYQIEPVKSGVLRADGGFTNYRLDDVLLTGGIYAYHYTVDPSVRTLSLLNGVSYKLNIETEEGDSTYEQTRVDDENQRGEMIALVKFEGHDEPYTILNPGRLDFCQDWKHQRVSELLVFIVNSDLADRNQWSGGGGYPSRILVSSLPCMGLRGSAERSTSYDGITETISANNLEFELSSYLPDLPPIFNAIHPDISMRLTGGTAQWSIQGVDSQGCEYKGGQGFTLTEGSNPSNLWMRFDLLPGSSHYRGYHGTVTLDSASPKVSYTVSCPDKPTENVEQVVGPIVNFFRDTPAKLDGALAGNLSQVEGDIVTNWVWNLTPVTK